MGPALHEAALKTSGRGAEIIGIMLRARWPRVGRPGAPAAALGLVLLSSACAPKSALPPVDAAAVRAELLKQLQLAIETWQDRQQRLADLSWPLLKAGVALCGDAARPAFGFALGLPGMSDLEEETAAARVPRIREADPIVTLVTDDSPAAHAGLRRGDVLTHVGRFRVGRGESDRHRAFERLRAFAGEKPPFRAVPIRFERHGEVFVQELLPDFICGYPVLLYEDPAINAFADGTNAYITTGMMRFTESDAELQMVVAHELSHNLAGHIRSKATNTLLGALAGGAAEALLGRATGVDFRGAVTGLGAVVGGRVHSQDFEREADYLSMYLLARAGVDTGGVAWFWRRMAVESPGSIANDHLSSHPSTPERFVLLEAAHDEIQARRLAGEPLLPNRRE